MTKGSKSDSPITIKKLDIRTIGVPIVGITELIVHRWSEKAKKQMLRKQMGKPVTKPAKNPEEDYEATIYRFEDESIGFPAIAFKAALVDACRYFDNLAMTDARQAIFVEGTPGKDGDSLVAIEGEPRMREDMVRLKSGVADIRYRAGFLKWKATLSITFNAGLISPEMLINLVEAAGFGVGVGEWRPSAPRGKSGTFGRFRVIRDEEAKHDL